MLQEPSTGQKFDGNNYWVNKNNTIVWQEDFMFDVNASGKITRQTIYVKKLTLPRVRVNILAVENH